MTLCIWCFLLWETCSERSLCVYVCVWLQLGEKNDSVAMWRMRGLLALPYRILPCMKVPFATREDFLISCHFRVVISKVFPSLKVLLPKLSYASLVGMMFFKMLFFSLALHFWSPIIMIRIMWLIISKRKCVLESVIGGLLLEQYLLR